MQESQWQKKKKRKRSQSRQNGQQVHDGAVMSTKPDSAPKSVLGRLQAVIARLLSRTCPVDLRNDGPAFVKLATQVVANDECSVKEGCLASCLVTHLLRRSSPSDVQSSTGGKLQMNPQHLLPFAKVIASRISPAAELHLPHLVLLSQLMVAHPGVCVSIRAQIEENLLPWLNFPQSSSECLLPFPSAAVSLAGDVWAVLPVPGPAGAADGEEHQDCRGWRGGQRSAGVAAARGLQLQRLMAALQGQLDRLLVGVLQVQGAQTAKTTTEALRIPPVTDHHVPETGTRKKFKNSGLDRNRRRQVDNSSGGESGNKDACDDISDPIKLVEALVWRCINILVFADRLLRSVGSGNNPHGVTLAARDLLLPLIRILQVSPASLQRYSTTEVIRLSQLWPSLHRAALATLATAITTLDHNLALWYPVLQRQLVSTLLAVKKTQQDGRVPSNKIAGAQQNGRVPSNKMAGAQQNGLVPSNKMAGAQQDGRVPSNKMADEEAVAEMQDIVHLVYKCLALLMEVSRGTAPVDVGLLKVVMEDLTVQPSTVVTLLNLSRKSIANMSIKKKSKKKGYTIVPKSNTPGAYSDDADAQIPLSLELSHGIVYYALELLQRVVSSPTSHYTLAVDCARLLQEELPKVARYFISEWRTFPHTLTGSGLCIAGESGLYSLRDLHTPRCARAETSTPEGHNNLCYASVSGRADLRCFFMGPLLMDKLIRLVASLGTGGTPHLPPHTTQLLHLLTNTQLQLQRSHQLQAAAEAGTRPLRFMLAHPNIGDFAQSVEDMRAAAFSAAASAANRDGADDNSDTNDNLMSDEADATTDDESIDNDGDGEMEEVDEDVVDVNTSTEEIFRNDAKMTESKELNANKESIEPSTEREENDSLRVNGDEEMSAREEEDGDGKEGEEDNEEDDKEHKEERPPSKRALAGSDEGGKQKNAKVEKKLKTEKKVKNEKKVKKSKKSAKDTVKAHVAEGVNPASCSVQSEHGDSEECTGDLTVEQMLAELVD